MEREVTITLKIDPAKYYKATDSQMGAVDLVIACLCNTADFNTELTVSSGQVSKTLDMTDR